MLGQVEEREERECESRFVVCLGGRGAVGDAIRASCFAEAVPST
jgi:hypothetical protein